MDPNLTSALFASVMERLTHVEQLLLGLATIGLAGWGFLHAAPEAAAETPPKEAKMGRVLFTIIFSATVTTAFCALYVAALVYSMVILKLEVLLKPAYAPIIDWYRIAGPAARLVYYLTAGFIPGMSLASLVYTYFEHLRAKRKGLGVLRPIWFVSCGAVLLSVCTAFAFVERLLALTRSIE